MLLSLEEACEVLDSELFQYCSPLTAGQVVVGIFIWSSCTKPAISQLGRRGYAKITHHTIQTNLLEEDNAAENTVLTKRNLVLSWSCVKCQGILHGL